MNFSKRVSRLSGSIVRDILKHSSFENFISFAGGLPAEEVMLDVRFDLVPRSEYQYGISEGELELRESIANRLNDDGRECSAQQVLILSGSQQGIDLVSKLFIDPDTPILIERPTYLAAVQVFRFFGARYFEIKCSSQGVDLESLLFNPTYITAKPAFAYIVPTFQNPTGYCYTKKERQRLGHYLEELKIPLVEDEPYRELYYDKVNRTPISSLSKR